VTHTGMGTVRLVPALPYQVHDGPVPLTQLSVVHLHSAPGAPCTDNKRDADRYATELSCGMR
jgi:hypothetical protein